MLVSDLFRVLDDSQDVDIYEAKKGVFIYTGECKDITSSCMELQVRSIYPNNDLLVISVY